MNNLWRPTKFHCSSVDALRARCCVQAVAIDNGMRSASSMAGASQRGPTVRSFTMATCNMTIARTAPRASQKSRAWNCLWDCDIGGQSSVFGPEKAGLACNSGPYVCRPIGRRRHRRRALFLRLVVTRRRLLRLVDAVQLKPVSVGNKTQSRRIRIGGVVFRKEDVDIVELRPIQPESRCVGLWIFGGEKELRGRWRRAVAEIGKIAKIWTNVHDLFALYSEQSRYQRRSLDGGDTGGVHEPKIADVFTG